MLDEARSRTKQAERPPTSGEWNRQASRRQSTSAVPSAPRQSLDVATNQAWFDAPLAIALLPALGSFLTGGDHLRDFLLLLIMLYYLHQLIKSEATRST